MPEHLAAEALQRTKRPTYGSLSLFDFEPGQYECSMGIFPVAGPNAQQQLLTQPLNSAAVGDVCHQPRVSFDPPGCGLGMRVPALPEPCCHHGAQGGRLPYSLSGFPAVPLQRLSMLFYLIDKSLSYRHSCRAMAGKHHSYLRREKTRKEAALSACSHPFRVFQNSQLFNSHGLFGSKKLCVAQMGIVVPLSTFSIPKNSAHNLVSPIGGKTISNKSSMIILRSPGNCIYT